MTKQKICEGCGASREAHPIKGHQDFDLHRDARMMHLERHGDATWNPLAMHWYVRPGVIAHLLPEGCQGCF